MLGAFCEIDADFEELIESPFLLGQVSWEAQSLAIAWLSANHQAQY